MVGTKIVYVPATLGTIPIVPDLVIIVPLNSRHTDLGAFGDQAPRPYGLVAMVVRKDDPLDRLDVQISKRIVQPTVAAIDQDRTVAVVNYADVNRTAIDREVVAKLNKFFGR